MVLIDYLPQWRNVFAVIELRVVCSMWKRANDIRSEGLSDASITWYDFYFYDINLKNDKLKFQLNTIIRENTRELDRHIHIYDAPKNKRDQHQFLSSEPTIGHMVKIVKACNSHQQQQQQQQQKPQLLAMADSIPKKFPFNPIGILQVFLFAVQRTMPVFQLPLPCAPLFPHLYLDFDAAQLHVYLCRRRVCSNYS